MNEKEHKHKELEENIGKLQLIEQNLQAFRMQRQELQAQDAEIDNALISIEGAKGAVYKIAGNIMLASDKDELQKELKAKKEIIGIRIKSIKGQEDALAEKFKTVQNSVLNGLKKEKNG
ncbi:prefoldin subunit [archaeon]|nr:prefoldin subunit [archaeon]